MSTETPRMTRAQKRQKRTAEILQVSLDIMGEEGFDALTVYRLAEKLSCTPGALYRYFPSKDAILVALQIRALGQLRELLQTVCARSEQLALASGHGEGSAVALAQILGVVRAYVGLSVFYPDTFRLLRFAIAEPRLVLGDREVAPVSKVVMALLGDISQLLSQAQRRGFLQGTDAEAPLRTVALWSAVHGAVMVGKFARFDASLFDSPSLATEQCRALLVGWGAKPHDLERARELTVQVFETSSWWDEVVQQFFTEKSDGMTRA